MKRKIAGYHLDEQADWVAELDCYHGQHVRHDPPFKNRPWVESETGRQAHLGEELNCVLCDRFEFPDGLLKNHSLAYGHWGRLHVLSGQLIYTVNHPEKGALVLSEDEQAVIVPCMIHAVRPIRSVRFFVEFFSKS
jgi:tellurite methyltransferase